MLSNFEVILGSPPPGGVADGWMGVGVVHEVYWGVYPCMHMHARMHAHACYNIANPMDFPKSNVGGHLHEITIYTIYKCACVCMHACMCVCTCVGGHPNHPPPHSHTAPTPKSCREPKTPKFNKSWTNRDNSILFEDSLPLNIPELI